MGRHGMDPLFQENLLVVGVADMKVCRDPEKTLATFSLGSCVAVVVYDFVITTGGMLHAILPEAGGTKGKGFNAFKFLDTGIPLLFREMYTFGAVKNRMRVSVFGGAHMLDDAGFFNIGSRNLTVMRNIFRKNGVKIDQENVDGAVSRTVRLKIGTGRIHLRFGGGKEIVL